MEELVLRGGKGQCLSVFSARDGVPTLSLNAKNQTPRLWLRINRTGEPGIVFFDKDGENPVEVIATHGREPGLKVQKFDDPNNVPLGPPLKPAVTP